MKKSKLYYTQIKEQALEYYKNNTTNITKCSKLFNIDRHSLSNFLKENDIIINPNGKQKINSNIFEIIDSEEKAYWLGFIYADGYVSKTKNAIGIDLAIKDIEHLKKFNSFLEKEKPIVIDKHRVRCNFKDTKIHSDLLDKGVFPNKSLILKFPSYNQVPKELMKHFIRGYADGDGSIYILKKDNSIHFDILGTAEFLKSLIKECDMPKRTLYKNNKNSLANCWFFQSMQKNALKLIQYLYTDANVFLERKYNKYLEYCRLREEIPKIITG